jgi:hypothetical protein
MADKPLFTLDIEGRWRLAYDAWQWLIQRQSPNGRWRPLALGLRTRGDVFNCLRHKDILITAEALHRIDTELMDSFVAWKARRTLLGRAGCARAENTGPFPTHWPLAAPARRWPNHVM